MGVVGKYLDLLPPAACERIYSAIRWTTRCCVDESGARNLLGHAEDWAWPDLDSVPECKGREVFFLRAAAGDQLWTDQPLITIRFTRLADRRGLNTAIQMVRARLARAAMQKELTRARAHLTVMR
jgi:hypothetical protein